jgi:hypothetical protein
LNYFLLDNPNLLQLPGNDTTTNPTVQIGQQSSQPTIASTAVASTITINIHGETSQGYLNTLIKEQAKC